MSDNSCQNCMTYRRGECLGKGLCEYYKPAPSFDEEMQKNWPKTMRHHSSYAGTHGSKSDWSEPKKKVSWGRKSEPKKEKKYVPKPQDTSEYDKLSKRVNLKLLRVNDIDSVMQAAILENQLYREDVIVWMTLDRLTINSQVSFKCQCLLQYKDHCMTVDGPVSRTKLEAMRLGLRDVIEDHIKMKCHLYIVTDRDLFGEPRFMNNKDRSLLEQLLKSCKSKGCTLCQLWLDNYADMIRKQVKNPKLLRDGK